MTLDASNRRALPWLVAGGLLAYPVALLVAAELGLNLGAGLDFFTSRGLARTLSYSGDPRRVSYQADPARPPIAALDGFSLMAQLGTAVAIQAAPATGATTAPGLAAPAGGATAAPGGGPATHPGASATPVSTPTPVPDGGLLPPLPVPLPSLPVTVPAPTPIITIPPLPVVTLLPPLPTQLRGRVQDGATGAPIAGAHVSVSQGLLGLMGVGTATTDQNGNYAVTGLLPGTTYTYSISATGYRTATGTFVTDATGQATVVTSLGH